jgi:hypothetical protein
MAQEKITGETPDLFQQLDGIEPAHLAANAPDLNIELEFRGALAYCLREASKRGLSRERIVDRMNQALPGLRKKITKRMLDGWTAASSEDRPFPAVYLPAFLWACLGYLAPLDVLARVLGLHLMDEQEITAAELGKALAEQAQVSKRKRLLLKQLGF